MESFLARVAALLFANYKHNISDLTFVFPNRRAGLFFQKYLSDITETPLFSPHIITINDCFNSMSSYQHADKFLQLFNLYEIYLSHSKSNESFDVFLFWGEMLLADFNEIDKYLVDAKQLFSNIKDLNTINDSFSYFTENQIQAIKEFWSSFSVNTSISTVNSFEAIWSVLYSIYIDFNNKLLTQNFATEGMICRDVIQKINSSQEFDFGDKYYVFIGFNALNPSEKKLFLTLQKLGKADFYWDYESDMLQDLDNKASMYYHENTSMFQSKFQLSSHTTVSNVKRIELIGVPSAVGQTKHVHSILNDLYPKSESAEQWLNTALVLPNESLLIPLLKCIPEQIKDINITMGLPISSTPVISFIDCILELQKHNRKSKNNTSFYFQSVLDVINHQFISLLYNDDLQWIRTEILTKNMFFVDESILKRNHLFELIFCIQNSTFSLIEYLNEILLELQKRWHSIREQHSSHDIECDFLYQVYLSLNRLKDVIDQVQFELTVETLIKLIKQLLNGLSIPFLGEPLNGLQIMGVLEVRGLDFDTIIITSFNEGVFPQKINSQSFIPYNLRKGFELPTFEQQDAITSYNFYRLIDKAKNIYLIYDTRSEKGNNGEISRYFNQLKYHYKFEIVHKSISYDLNFSQNTPIQINKSDEVLAKLELFCDAETKSKALSSSAINTYIDCGLKFYLQYVVNIGQEEEINETIESNTFGILYHAVLEYIYEEYKGKMVTVDDLKQIIKSDYLIDNAINRAFAKKYFKMYNGVVVELEGNNFLIATILKRYIQQALKKDQEYAPFVYIDTEKLCEIKIPILNGTKHVNIKGFIDRVDEKNDVVRILDYKTGKRHLNFITIEDLFDSSLKERPKHVFQTFLYGLLYKQYSNGKQIFPGVFYMKESFKDEFTTALIQEIDKKNQVIVTDFNSFESEFVANLTLCLDTIFDTSTPFIQTQNSKVCDYCDFKTICNR
jgi:hypothetical protein